MGTDELRGPGELRSGERIGGLDRFTQQIRARRAEIGLSQEDLASLADVSRGTVKTAERGLEVKLTPKTIVGIHYALGWAPRFPQDLSGGFDPVEVLSADAFRPIADAVLTALRQADNADERAEARRMLLELHAAVDALAEAPPRLSANFEYLATRLSETLSVRDVATVNREIAQRTKTTHVLPVGPAPVASGLGRGIGVLLPATAERMPGSVDDMWLILESNLPDEVKQQLMKHMAARRAEVEESLRRELSLLVDQFSRLTREVVAPSASPPPFPPTATEIKSVLMWSDSIRRTFVRRHAGVGTGYDAAQVDAVVEGTHARLEVGLPVPLDALRSSQFRLVSGGYSEGEVEAWLKGLRKSVVELGLAS